ncbi:aminotransferase class V-fold PLP-dependent enzyme [Ginsengibacter hankyongi]|uniref:Aminotransferase class V-fold PLP-dependent enzyme n=1 Tax=Ginsengibacter hankyongi TaxID=2607284 RepID=A0A5J5IFE6_9BACT|nr:aminotransferase class V-fold PLP-dependent enzyme [Ginsengibacter hankyongi]KAA9037715.1 aminotransferase class V-fold PLP-dependent enzyme [Ginsengibacter hankyongi]
MKRREIIKGLGLLPLGGTFLGSILPGQSLLAAPSRVPKRNLLKELGIRSFINAAGTYTTMTASLMHDEVVDAIEYSSKEFCMLNEVQDKVGEKIAQMVHAEGAMVTAGAFSALTLGMAGILTGTDQQKIKRLPHRLEEAGIKSEVLLQKGHFDGYEQALYNTGVTIISVETADDVERAVNEKTASMHFLNCNAMEGKIMHEQWLQLAKKHNLPATIDIAADVPPVSNLWKYNDMGFSFVALSGGKAIRGPQSTGVLMGKKNIIEAARLNDSPNGVTIGRGMKVNKEEMLGMYAALDSYINQDHDKEWKMWEDNIGYINDAVKNIKGVTTEISVPPIANHTPKLRIAWDKNIIRTTRENLGDKLRTGNPSIEVISWGDEDNSISLTVFMLKKGEEKIVARRIKEELSVASS